MSLSNDILTVMWKEWRELIPFGVKNTSRSRPYSLLVILLVFGIFMPLQSGRRWVDSPVALIYWAWVPLFLVSSAIADSFAGERERHTLETLLASRLSDTAILLGKAFTAISYAWGLTLASLALGLVTVNLTAGRGELLLYSPYIVWGGAALGLLTAALAAFTGVLVSLHASTVRQAAQTMSIAIMLVLFVPVFGLQALPGTWKAAIAAAASHVDGTAVLVVAALVLLAIDIVLLAAARLRFQRPKLILS